MEKDKKKKKKKEPYPPEDTPKPPQIIDPNMEKKRENPIEEEHSGRTKPDNPTDAKEKRVHLLGDEAEIDDETTI